MIDIKTNDHWWNSNHQKSHSRTSRRGECRLIYLVVSVLVFGDENYFSSPDSCFVSHLS